jgi:hypothetical protein
MVLGVSCMAWQALFVFVLVTLVVGNVLGFHVWKSRRLEQPSWRPYVGFGYLFRPEYYDECASHGARKRAAALIVAGTSMGITLGSAVLYVVLSGETTFCSFQL